VWISATHKRIKYINEKFLAMMQDEGKLPVRLIAVHHASKVTTPRPDHATRELLYNIAGAATNRSGIDTQMVTHMDVCIGTRIRLYQIFSLNVVYSMVLWGPYGVLSIKG
jgi:hypothetical protein